MEEDKPTKKPPKGRQVANRTGVKGWPKGKSRESRIYADLRKPKGWHNPKREVYEDIIVKALDGEHPLQALSRMAKESEEVGDKALAVSAYKELANYCAPKLKAVEIKQGNEEYKPITIVVSDEGSKEINKEAERLSAQSESKSVDGRDKEGVIEAVLVDD